MSRRPELTFSQRRHTYGQQTYEKMLYIHHKSTNQNHSEGTPPSGQNGYQKRKPQPTNAGEEWGKGVYSYTISTKVTWCTRCVKESRDLFKENHPKQGKVLEIQSKKSKFDYKNTKRENRAETSIFQS